MTPAAVTAATAKTPLQITTCPRRGPEPAAVTAKTAKMGLEITGGYARARSLASTHSPCSGCSSSPAVGASPHSPAAGSSYSEVANTWQIVPQLTRSRWSGAPRPVTQHGSLPGRPLQAAGSPFSQGSGPGSEDCREPLARIANCRPTGSAACYFGLVIDPRFGDVPPRWGFKSPLGHFFEFFQFTAEADRRGHDRGCRRFRPPAGQGSHRGDGGRAVLGGANVAAVLIVIATQHVHVRVSFGWKLTTTAMSGLVAPPRSRNARLAYRTRLLRHASTRPTAKRQHE